MRREYGKLVRDRISEIIRANGETPITSTLPTEAYIAALNEKLLEETREYLEAHDKAEICDILEVLYAILDARGISIGEIEAMRREKAERNGAFRDRIYLEAVEGARNE